MLIPEDQRVKMEGAAGDDGRKQWAGKRGTGLLPAVPSKSAPEVALWDTEVVGQGERTWLVGRAGQGRWTRPCSSLELTWIGDERTIVER